MKIFVNIVLGVLTLHNSDCLHRDLNPKNIFIKKFVDNQGNERELLKIGDFGTAKNGMLDSIKSSL